MKKTVCLTLLASLSSLLITFAQTGPTPAPALPESGTERAKSAEPDGGDFAEKARAAAAEQFRTMVITGAVLSVIVGGGVFLLGMRRKDAPKT